MAAYQPLLFVDTNVVHYARLYLGFAKERGLHPFGPSADNPDDTIKATFVGRTQQNYVEGRRLVDYLTNQHDSGAQIEYSPVTRLELVSGLLRGKAMLDAAREGITHRMWNRMDEREMFDRLKPDAYEDIQNSVGGLETEFKEAGVDLVETDPNRMSEVWTLASQILGIVFLDLGDCVIYASALLAEADQLVTADRYFRDTVSWMHNPGSASLHQQARFSDVKSKMEALLATAIGVDASDINLPAARKDW